MTIYRSIITKNCYSRSLIVNRTYIHWFNICWNSLLISYHFTIIYSMSPLAYILRLYQNIYQFSPESFDIWLVGVVTGLCNVELMPLFPGTFSLASLLCRTCLKKTAHDMGLFTYVNHLQSISLSTKFHELTTTSSAKFLP